MTKVLAKKTLIVAIIHISVWVTLGFGVYLYPQSRTLLWLFWISIAASVILPLVRTLIAIGIICQQSIHWMRRYFV